MKRRKKKDLMITIENWKTSTNFDLIYRYSYQNDALGRRINQAKSGSAISIAETSNSANPSPGDLIGWRDTPITEIDIRSFNPFRFSSEYHDDELSLIYYNYRHYNPATAR